MPNPNNPVFPSAICTDLNLPVASNRALSTLPYPVDSSQTSFTVVNGTVFNPPCLVQIDTEVILVGALSGNVFQSCVRGFAGTSNVSHGQNAEVKGYVFSYHNNQIAAEIKSIEAGLGVNFGNVVMQYDYAGGGTIGGVFSNLHLDPNGVVAGTYGGFAENVIITVDATGRVTTIANAPGNTNYPVFYKAAIVQGTNAVLGFSFANSNAPNPVPYTEGSGSVYAVAQFTQGNAYWVQDHFYLPDDWQSDTISLDIYWRIEPGASLGTVGNVTWNVAVAPMRPGLGPDLIFGSTSSVTTVVPSATGVAAKSRITPVVGAMLPGDELFFIFSRSATDTCNAPAEVVSLKFNINRDFALVQ